MKKKRESLTAFSQMIKSAFVPYNKSEPLNGIFSYLKNESGVNDIVGKRIISLSGSSEDASENHPYCYALGINITTTYQYWRTISTSEENQYFVVDFLKSRVSLSDINIWVTQYDIFQSYKIYGSTGSSKFSLIGTYTTLENHTDFRHVKMPIDKIGVYRAIKIVPQGKRNSGDYRFVIHRLDFFGVFYATPPMERTCRCAKNNKSIITFQIILMTK